MEKVWLGGMGDWLLKEGEEEGEEGEKLGEEVLERG